jgi:hypothetical protein
VLLFRASISDQETAITDVTKPVVVQERNHCLVVIYDGAKVYERRRFDLVAAVTSIGRHDDNQIVFEEERVSRPSRQSG